MPLALPTVRGPLSPLSGLLPIAGTASLGLPPTSELGKHDLIMTTVLSPAGLALSREYEEFWPPSAKSAAV